MGGWMPGMGGWGIILCTMQLQLVKGCARRLGQHVPTGRRRRQRRRQRRRWRWRRRLRIVGIVVEVVVLLLRRLQEAVGCIFSCTALAMHFSIAHTVPPPPSTAPPSVRKMALGLRTCYSKWLPCILIFAYFSVCCHCWQRCLLLVCCFAKNCSSRGRRGWGRAVCSRCSYIQYIYTAIQMHMHICVCEICHGECSAQFSLLPFEKKNHGDLKYQNYGQNALHNVLQRIQTKKGKSAKPSAGNP